MITKSLTDIPISVFSADIIISGICLSLSDMSDRCFITNSQLQRLSDKDHYFQEIILKKY